MSQIQKIKSLRQGEKALRDNVPIRFNEWNTVTAKNLSNLPKTATVKFTVLTNNHGVGANNRQKETSHGSQMGLRLDRIEDNPKYVIETWQSMRNELMPRMADVDAVSAMELFGAHLTGAATREYSQILFDCAEKLYVDIHASFNERYAKWTITDKANAKSKLYGMRALNNSKPSCIISTSLDATISTVITNSVKRSFSSPSNTRRMDLSSLLPKEDLRMMPRRMATIRRRLDTSPALITRVRNTTASVATVLSGGIAKMSAIKPLQT
jgi:hypothetical protein